MSKYLNEPLRKTAVYIRNFYKILEFILNINYAFMYKL